METFTVSIPENLKKELDTHPEINWAEYLKKKFELRIMELKRFEQLKSSRRI
jgi:predicted metal-dependent peptidase